MDKRIIQDLKNHWRNCNSSILGFAQTIPSEQWGTKPFNPRFKTYSWEFACILRTRMCYSKGLKTGRLIFAHQEDITDKTELINLPKAKIISKLEDLAREILSQIENIDQTYQVDMVISLLNHERLHQGKLILYFSQANLTIPESFTKTWGESNFPIKNQS